MNTSMAKARMAITGMKQHIAHKAMQNKAYLIFILSGHPHSVKGRFQPAIAPVLQGIPNVDGDGPRDRVTGDPQPRLHSFFRGGILASTHL